MTNETKWTRRAPLELKILNDQQIEIWFEGEKINAGVHGLSVLEATEHPISKNSLLSILKEGVKEAEALEIERTVETLCEKGVLYVEAKDRAPSLAQMPFSVYSNQSAMLNDRERTEAFLGALQEQTKDEHVVLDIGAGNGVLSLAAARAGARRVFAVEATDLSVLAQKVFEANEGGDKISLLRAWSTRVHLEERADLLVTETIGHDPFAERILETVLDARSRLLKPDAKILPARLRVYALPIEIPRPLLAAMSFGADEVTRWRAWYGIDFSPLYHHATHSPQWLYVLPTEVMGWHQLTAPIKVADIDLQTFSKAEVETFVQAEVRRPGTANGVLVYFEVDVDDAHSFSTKPGIATPSCSWKNALWLIGEGIKVAPEEIMELRYTYSSVPGSKVSLVKTSPPEA